MISITKQLKAVPETPHAVRIRKQQQQQQQVGKTRWKLWPPTQLNSRGQQQQLRQKPLQQQQQKRICQWLSNCKETQFHLLLILLLKVFAVALVPNTSKTTTTTVVAATAAIQTTTFLSITFTTEAAIARTVKTAMDKRMTLTTMQQPFKMTNDSIEAYEGTLKTTPAMLLSATDDYNNNDDDFDADFTLSINKATNFKKAAVSRHIATISSSSIINTKTTTTNSFTSISTTNKASNTTAYIKQNMWTNTPTQRKQQKHRHKYERRHIHNNSGGGGESNSISTNINEPTAVAFMASTIAITTSSSQSPSTKEARATTAFAVLAATNTTMATAATNFQQQQKLFENPKATDSAIPTLLTPSLSSSYDESSNNSYTTDPIPFWASTIAPSSSSFSSTQQTPNSTTTNMSFHQHCMNSRDSFADLITIVLYTIVCIVGLFGNTLVIYVVLRFSKMQTVTNIYILNLAIADECFLIGIPFLLYTMRICSWTFGEYMCKAYMVSTSITQFTSSIFLLIMSADRFLAVCHPIASPRYRTIHIAKYVSALAWVTSAVLMLPVILFASTVTQEDGLHYSCNIEWPERYKKHSGTTFILYTFFLGFATPLCFILCFYYLVIKKLHAVGRKHKSKEKKRSHRKVTRLVLTVITVYILCWLPQWISQVALISSNPDQRDLSRLEVLIFLLIGCLAYSNSAMNPILYAFLSDNFRKSFSKAFTCMAGHEVNAQLQVEPSVFTKHGGSRRRSSKRIVAQTTPKKQTKATLHANPTLGNNNSSTTTSTSTATQNDRNIIAVTSGMSTGTGMASTTTTTLTTTSTGGNSVNFGLPPFCGTTINGRVSAENVMLVLDKEESVCATVIERKNSRHLQHCSGSTLQTDL